MTALLHFVITLVVCSASIAALLRGRWTWRSPLTSIVTWQLLALAWVLCVIGGVLALAVAPYRRSMPTALGQAIADLWTGRTPSAVTVVHQGLLLGGLVLAAALLSAGVTSAVVAARVRRHHLGLLSLVARHDPGLPGVLVLEHPIVTAYCVPGIRRANLVVSTGALRILTRQELAAVLEHERAHAREHHDLALIPFLALRRLFPRCRAVRAVVDAVAMLLEMRADDVACSRQSAPSLAAALRRFRQLGSPPPAGALGIADASVAARLDRIARPRPGLSTTARWLVIGTAVVLFSTPLSFFLVR